MNGRAAPSPRLPLGGGEGGENPTVRHFPGAKDNLVGGRGNPIRWEGWEAEGVWEKVSFWLPQALNEKSQPAPHSGPSRHFPGPAH